MCISLAPIWDSLAREFNSNKKVTIAEVDCTAHNSICKVGKEVYLTIKNSTQCHSFFFEYYFLSHQNNRGSKK